MRWSKSNFLLAIIAVLGAFLIAQIFHSSPFTDILPTYDSAVFKYVGECVLGGGVIGVDCWDHKGPFLWLIEMVGAIQINGGSILWLVEIFSLAIAILFTYLAVRKVLQKNSLRAFSVIFIVYFFALTFMSDGGNRDEMFALPLIAIALFVAARNLNNTGSLNWQFLIIGFLAMLASMINANLGFCIAILGAAQIFSIKNSARAKIAQIVFAILGAAIPMIIYLIYCIKTNSLSDGFYAWIFYNLDYIQVFSISAQNFLRDAFSIIIFSSGLFLCLVLAFFAQRITATRQQRFIMISGIGLCVAAVFAMSGIRTLGHYYVTMIPFCAGLAGILSTNLHKNLAKPVLSVVFLLATVPSFAFYKNILGENPQEKSDYRLVQEISSVVKENSASHDSILVSGGNLEPNPSIYLSSDRKFSGTHAFLPVVSQKLLPEKITDKFYADFNAQNPEIIVWNGRDQNRDELIFKFIEKQIAQKYHLISETKGDELGNYQNVIFQIYKLR